MKQCTKCKQEKDYSEFYKHRKSKDGYKSQCKCCVSEDKKRKGPNQICNQCGCSCWAKDGVCQSCQSKNVYNHYATLKLGDKIYTKHKYAKYSYIRYWARQTALKLGWNKCCKCGYDKHFEVAHIKPISEYSEDALLIEINNPSNLLALCPNCHWEFDNLKVPLSGNDPASTA